MYQGNSWIQEILPQENLNKCKLLISKVFFFKRSILSYQVNILLGKTDRLTWFAPFALFFCLVIIQTQKPLLIPGFENICAC